MPTRPLDSLHLRNMLYDALDHESMHDFFDYWINKDEGARYAFPSRRLPTGQRIPWSGFQVANGMQHALRMTEAWFVSDEIAQVVAAIAHEMPPEVLQPEDMPSTHGWLVFEDPYMLKDVRNNAIPVRALLWGTQEVGKEDYDQVPKQGIVVWCITDLNDRLIDDYFRWDDPSKMVAMINNHLQLTPAQVFAVTFNALALEMVDRAGMYIYEKAGSPRLDRLEEDPEPGVWRFFDPSGARELAEAVRKRTGEVIPAEQFVRVRPEPLTQFLQALWRFQAQKLAAIERPHVPKTALKTLMRRQMHLGPVSVIKLRKRERGNETGAQYVLSHRFVVRGHWRRQWYPSEQRHKSIYIQPFLKGPEDAPLLARDRVNAIVR